MKILDTDLPVKLGYCIHVVNCEKEEDPKGHVDEPPVFICIQLETEDGNVEYPVLLTDEEYSKVEKGYSTDMNKLVAGRTYPTFRFRRNCYDIVIKDWTGETCIGFFKREEIVAYYKRALYHPKSVTKKSLITDLFD